ncbi:hypothetical protein ACN5PR_002286 [Cronobacter dublinensis]
MDKSREHFEAWYQNKYCMLGDDFDRRGERYQYKTVQLMWEAWQESRAAVEIEIPEVLDYWLGREGFAESIRAAGLKVKGE